MEETTKTLERLAHSLDALPDDTREAVLAEFEQQVVSLSRSHLTDGQRKSVADRLAVPRQYASDAAVASVLSRYRLPK